MLTPQRHKILELLVEYAYLSRRDFYSLVENTSPTETSHERRIRRILQGFYRYLRHGPIIDYDSSKKFLTYETIFWLSSKGLALAQTAGIDNGEGKANDEHSPRTLDHEYEITRFHLCLKQLAAEQCHDLYWQQRDLRKTVYPDAIFALAKEYEFYYFLEIEKSKQGRYIDGKPQILRKLARYYNYYNSDLCEDEWGFRLFRVVIVAQTEGRRENLLNHLRESFNHRMFWVSTLDTPFEFLNCSDEKTNSLFNPVEGVWNQ